MGKLRLREGGALPRVTPLCGQKSEPLTLGRQGLVSGQRLEGLSPWDWQEGSGKGARFASLLVGLCQTTLPRSGRTVDQADLRWLSYAEATVAPSLSPSPSSGVPGLGLNVFQVPSAKGPRKEREALLALVPDWPLQQGSGVLKECSW